jgi:hypothetical protein
MNFPQLQTSLDRLLSTVAPETARILDRALSGDEISVDDGVRLFDAEGSELLA